MRRHPRALLLRHQRHRAAAPFALLLRLRTRKKVPSRKASVRSCSPKKTTKSERPVIGGGRLASSTTKRPMIQRTSAHSAVSEVAGTLAGDPEDCAEIVPILDRIICTLVPCLFPRIPLSAVLVQCIDSVPAGAGLLHCTYVFQSCCYFQGQGTPWIRSSPIAFRSYINAPTTYNRGCRISAHARHVGRCACPRNRLLARLWGNASGVPPTHRFTAAVFVTARICIIIKPFEGMSALLPTRLIC